MTLRSRLLLSNLAMVVVPLALVVLLNAVLLSFVQEGAAPGPAFRFTWPWQNTAARRPLPTRQMLSLTQSTLRKINVETLEHPDKLGEATFWAGLDDALSGNDAGIAVRRGNRLLFVSADLGEEGLLEGLPAYGTFEGTLTPRSALGQRYRLLGQWDFPLGGEHLSVFLLWITQPWNNAIETFSTILLSGFFVSTVGVGLLLTWLFGRSLLLPVRRLQEAAARIAADDLSPSPPHGRKDELAPLFETFETMRGRLEANRHLRERYEADRRDLIAHLAHDLKTPVTAINGYVQGILDGVASTEEKRRQYLEVIAAKARELDRRTDELVFFSSLELGTLPYEFRALDLSEFLQGLWKDFLHEYGPQGLTGPSPVVPVSAPVSADPARLRRAFANLADNTVKFRRGETVSWRWSLEAVEARWRVTLADDGLGIGDEALGHVFERFYREDASRNQVPGTGLGLAIVKRIVEDHGGNVSAESGPLQGTTIVIELPRS